MLAKARVVIIGGTSGIGLATAKAAAAAGAHLVIAGRSPEKIAAAKEAIGGKVRSAAIDATKEDQVRRFFEKVGEFDHLVTSIHSQAVGLVTDLSTESAREVFESKFWAQYFAAKHGAPKIQPGGSITFLSGISSRRPFPRYSISAAVNGAIEGLCKRLAVELAPVRVNVIAPGLIDTPALDTLAANQRTAMNDFIKGWMPLKRMGTAEEVAQMVVYAMENTFTTGAILDIDGGHSLI